MDQWILQTVIEGYHISLNSRAQPRDHAIQPSFLIGKSDPAAGGDSYIVGETSNTANSSPNKGLLLQYIYGTKKRWRLDTNYHPSYHMKSKHFKMASLHTVKSLLQKEDWMTKIDLKDAFLWYQ